MYSVQNTSHPLKLKVHNTACLCTPCITENGEICENSLYADPWKEVQLIPVKGESKKKHMKCKHPSEYVTARSVETNDRECCK